MPEPRSLVSSSRRFRFSTIALSLCIGVLAAGPAMARPRKDTFQPQPLKPHPLKPSASHRHNEKKVVLTAPYTQSTTANRLPKGFKPRPTGYHAPKPKDFPLSHQSR